MASNSKLIFYNLKRILGTKADYNLIIGQRSNGKTYACLKHLLEVYKNTKKRGAYLRRWADDLKGFYAEQLFDPLSSVVEKLFGEGYYILYFRHKYYLCNPDGEKIDVVCYALAISEAAHTKSVAYSNIGIIIFDEFIQMSGERMLVNEKEKFENTLSTLIRYKTDVVIFMLANTVSKFSWVFVYFGIDINKVEQGSIVTKELPTDDEKGVLRVSLEYCEYNENIGKKSSKYTKSSMIKTGQWQIPPTDDIPTVKNEIVKERLLCSFHDPDADVNVGCFIHKSVWYDIAPDTTSEILVHRKHVREFLVLRQIDRRSKYFHLTNDKSLDYHTYNDMGYFLRDLLEEGCVDFEHELFMGRVFCDNMFTADFFNHIWQYYGGVKVRDLL